MATTTRFDEAKKSRRTSDAETLDRQPPRNLEAERAVLGSILLVPEKCDDVALIVKPDDFYDDANRKLYGHLLAMHDAGKRIDITLLVERLRSTGDLELVGGMPYLAEVAQSVPNASHVEYYVEIIRSKATLRSLIYASTEILRDAYDESSSPREIVNRAEEKIFQIEEARITGQVSQIRDVLHLALERIDALMKHEHVSGGVETGFSGLDELTGGLHNSELTILAARPSMGKTSLAMNIAEYVAIELRIATLFVSLEMSALELADRLLCSTARVNGHQLRNGHISLEDRKKLIEQSGRISDAPLYVDDTPSRTITEIAAAARRLRRRSGLGLVVIDYLQLIEPDNPKDPRQEQVAKIARRLKMLARELQVPVLCLAQLNRQAELAKDNRPRLSHLRESGAIEQDADLVIFVHRELYADEASDRNGGPGQADIVVAKQRNGPTGDIKLLWRHEFTRFENLTARPYDEFEQYAEPF